MEIRQHVSCGLHPQESVLPVVAALLSHFNDAIDKQMSTYFHLYRALLKERGHLRTMFGSQCVLNVSWVHSHLYCL